MFVIFINGRKILRNPSELVTNDKLSLFVADGKRWGAKTLKELALAKQQLTEINCNWVLTSHAETFGHYPHPKSDEIFIGNVPSADLTDGRFLQLKSLRYEEPAYDIDGEELPGYIAVIINKSDEATYDKIMMSKRG